VQIGRVIGTVVATAKQRKLEGAKLLLVQPLTLAGEALRRKGAPVDAAIIGIVDDVTLAPGALTEA